LCGTPSVFRVFVKHPAGISACQHYILGAGNGYGNDKKFEDVVPRKVGEPHPRCD
jgi:hypothetical protein